MREKNDIGCRTPTFELILEWLAVSVVGEDDGSVGVGAGVDIRGVVDGDGGFTVVVATVAVVVATAVVATVVVATAVVVHCFKCKHVFEAVFEAGGRQVVLPPTPPVAAAGMP